MDKEKISTNERGLLTTTEAAHYLGVKPSYLYKMMMRRAIPYYKPGGKLCFFAKEILGRSGRGVPPSAMGAGGSIPVLGDRAGGGVEYGSQANPQSTADNGARRGLDG